MPRASRPQQKNIHCVVCQQEKPEQNVYLDLDDKWCQNCLVAERKRNKKEDMISVGVFRRPPRYMISQTMWAMLGY